MNDKPIYLIIEVDDMGPTWGEERTPVGYRMTIEEAQTEVELREDLNTTTTRLRYEVMELYPDQ